MKEHVLDVPSHYVYEQKVLTVEKETLFSWENITRSEGPYFFLFACDPQ